MPIEHSTPKPPSEPQKAFVLAIYRELGAAIDPTAFETALTSWAQCDVFIKKYKGAHNASKALKAKQKEQKDLETLSYEINSVDFITPDLRKAVIDAATPQEKTNIIRKYQKSERRGFSHLDASTLHSTSEKLLGYWLEGLQSTAFAAMGSLPNLIGEPDSVFSFDEIEELLNSQRSDAINFDQPFPPVRHLVLKLVDERLDKKNEPAVLSVLPLMAVRDEQAIQGYHWVPAKERAPLFNRELIGETARWPGLYCNNVDAFDAWAMEQGEMGMEADNEASAQLTLHDALAIWNEAFAILAEPGHSGVRGWIEHFMGSRSQVWQIKKRRPVFSFVDGGAANGPSRQVCNVYRQLLAERELFDHQGLALFLRAADVRPLRQEIYDTGQQGLDSKHMTRYSGHMDAFKDGKREGFALDPAQRDALIALEMTGDGELLAVNGPPGTGKTSLLRGVIASLWVGPLLTEVAQPPCPLILACAATNQAVTNVISSFDETPGPSLFSEDGVFLSGGHVGTDSRWLPHLKSYGWYAPPTVTDKVRSEFSEYQLIDRKSPNKPWQLSGTAERFGTLEDTLLEDAYLNCAQHFFDAKLDLPAVLKRLRQRVAINGQQIETLQRQLGEWLAELRHLMQTAPWTPSHKSQQERLLLRAEPLAGKSGRRTQLKAQIAVLDAKYERIAHLNDFSAPMPQYVLLLATLPADETLHAETDFHSIKQQLAHLSELTKKLETTRHLGFVQRIKAAFSAVFYRDETEQRWAAMREAMHAVNLSVREGPPDIDAWADAIAERRRLLRTRLDYAAAEGLRLGLAREGVTLPSTSDYAAVWPEQLETHRQALRSQRARLVLEVANIDAELTRIKAELAALESVFRVHVAASTRAKEARTKIVATLASLGDALPLESSIFKTMDSALLPTQTGTQTADGLTQHLFDLNQHTQDWLDTHVRTRIFHLSARYWEGRYIQSIKAAAAALHADESYVMCSDEQLRQLAMLAPVFVVTAFSAPKLMRRSLRGLDEDLPPYLFGEADLLIVDEAGQGTPEIGACAFMFARRAIVVGDTAQLEPVWSMGESADKGLTQRFGLTKILPSAGESPYHELRPSGVLLARGSVMRMAQRASEWSNPAFPDTPGLTLTNHYRCLTPIIEICNRMVYGSRLHVATATPKKLWRPELQRLGFLVTDAIGNTKMPAGSRHNPGEAECIARWVHENEASIVKHYSKKDIVKIEDVLAIITPFSGQIEKLKRALAKQYGLPWKENDKEAIYNRITINTVHTLQGAERQIVIFAMVETSDPPSPQFYDKGTNLINVAVSRAKEMFIVALSQKAVDYARALEVSALGKASDYLWQAVVTKGSRLNGRRLVIVESPNKCETVREALGASIELEVLATEGHIAELGKPEQWTAITSGQPTWSPMSAAGEKVFRRVETLWPDLEACYLATDPDAEGEAIAWHILRVLRDRAGSGDITARIDKSPHIKRMRFFNLKAEEVRQAYDDAADGLDAGMVKSALARALLDHLITTEYPARLAIGKPNTFARGIGRVQLGVLDLVHKAQQEAPAYAIAAHIPLVDGSQLTSFALAPTGMISEGSRQVWSTDKLAVATEAALRIRRRLEQDDASLTVHWKSEPLTQLPGYPGLNTARLLALAWRTKRMHPRRAMEALQTLYEGGTELAPQKHNPRSALTSKPESRTLHQEE